MTRYVRQSVLIHDVNLQPLRSPRSLSAQVPLLCVSLPELALKIRTNQTGSAHRMPQTLQKIVSTVICGISQDCLSSGHVPRPKVSNEILFL